MVAIFAPLLLKYPGVAKFAKRFGKYILIAAAIGAAYWAVSSWLSARDAASYDRGFTTAESQMAEKIEVANAAALRDERLMNTMAQAAAVRTKDQLSSLTIKLDQHQKDITDEVSKDPIYRNCLVTDRVFDSSNASRTTVNTSIGPGNTGRDRPKPATAETAAR